MRGPAGERSGRASRPRDLGGADVRSPGRSRAAGDDRSATGGVCRTVSAPIWPFATSRLGAMRWGGGSGPRSGGHGAVPLFVTCNPLAGGLAASNVSVAFLFRSRSLTRSGEDARDNSGAPTSEGRAHVFVMRCTQRPASDPGRIVPRRHAVPICLRRRYLDSYLRECATAGCRAGAVRR